MNRCEHVRHRDGKRCVKPPHRESLHNYGRMAPVSAKRAAENEVRQPLIAEMKEEQPWCSRCGRTDLRLDAHELLSRARGGSITDPENIDILCAACHHEVTFEHHKIPDADRWVLSQFGGAA